jgi:hypothetical protein
MKAFLVLSTAILYAGPLAAQTCLGAPMPAGSIALGGGAAFTDGAKGFHIGSNGYDRSRVTWGVSVGLTDVEDVDKNATDIGASLGYVVSSSQHFTVCPGVSGGYSWWGDSEAGADADISALYGSIGVGLGLDVPLESGPTLGLFARPALLFQRTSLEVSGTVEFEDSETDNAFGADVGVSLGLNRAYITAYTSFTSVEDSNAVFGISLGFLVR